MVDNVFVGNRTDPIISYQWSQMYVFRQDASQTVCADYSTVSYCRVCINRCVNRRQTKTHKIRLKSNIFTKHETTEQPYRSRIVYTSV